MYYIYILYSEKYDKYYVGLTNDLERRLDEHNSGLKSNFTSKYRPWKLIKAFEVGDSLGLARKIENFIKRQKSRKFIIKLIEFDNLDDLKRRFDDVG